MPRTMRLLRLSALVTILSIALLAPAAASAETYSGLELKAEVSDLITSGRDAGMATVKISWDRTEPGGTNDSCTGPWRFEAIQIKIKHGDLDSDPVVATVNGSGQRGAVMVTMPAPPGSESNAYTAFFTQNVTRTISDGDCEFNYHTPHEDTRVVDDTLTFELPYPEDTDCTFTVDKVHGKVGMQLAGANASTSVKAGTTFFPGATLTASGGAWVELHTNVGGVDTDVRISGKVQFTKGDCTARQNFSWYLLFGKIWSKISGLAVKKPTINIITHNGTTGVRGTTYEVSASGSGGSAVTKLKVTEGTVRFWSPKHPGVVRLVGTGKTSTIRGSGTPSRPVKWH